MKTEYFTLFVITFLSLSAYTQDSTVIKNDYKKDTLRGRHFGNYIKPENGIKATSPDYGIDRDPTFRKCKNIESSEGRRKCFSETFYGHLRKKIRHDTSKLGDEAIEMIVQFTITKTGEIRNIHFIKSDDKSGDYEKEMIRVINKLPPLEPGTKNGSPVDIPFTFPIKFS
ncbi:energy transducer TonB [Flagellimonas meishanensis]|uniref:energy transducer TonB n=1 Tax=Flagellimonas meishanensis TaxID=2873264 RepID=UPI001CA75FE0|nr:energy transducer TonB [[Muricauda] meishanensis]